MPTVKRLLEPILEGGIKSTHYFNGRVLTAEDLRADQDANRLQRQLLAQVVGQGVLEGLEVSRVDGSARRVQITPGQGLSPDGHLLSLGGSEPYVLEIVPNGEAAASTQAGQFYQCNQQVVSTINTGYGLYLLVAAPAGGYEGSAPLSGIQSDGKITGCGSRYAVDGIQFRVVLYRTAESLVEYEPMRNLVAHDFFGTHDGILADILAPRRAYGEMDKLLAEGRVARTELPLALFYWGTDGIAWLDMWAVRRRVAPALSGSPWDVAVGPRRQAEAEAMFLQFQDDLKAYREENPGTLAPVLRSRFRYVPPFGYVPIDQKYSADEQLSAYFEYVNHMRVYPDPRFLRSMLQKAALVDPVDLSNEQDYPVLGVYWESGMQHAIFFRKGRGTRPTARV